MLAGIGEPGQCDVFDSGEVTCNEENHYCSGYCYLPDCPKEAEYSAAEGKPAEEDHSPCVEAGSVGQCENCLESVQCSMGNVCDGVMKKCVEDESQMCEGVNAECLPECHEVECGDYCQNKDYPLKWQLRTCTAEAGGTHGGLVQK